MIRCSMRPISFAIFFTPEAQIKNGTLVGRRAGTVARTKRRTRRTAPVRWGDERLVLELVGTAPYHTVRTVGF